jgi:hypothetical protein
MVLADPSATLPTTLVGWAVLIAVVVLIVLLVKRL